MRRDEFLAFSSFARGKTRKEVEEKEKKRKEKMIDMNHFDDNHSPPLPHALNPLPSPNKPPLPSPSIFLPLPLSQFPNAKDPPPPLPSLSLNKLPSSRSSPNCLQKAIALRQPIETVVALAHGAQEAAQRIRLRFARVPPVLIYLANGDLHRRVVFGRDQPVGGAAFSGHVALFFLGEGGS